MAGLHCGDRLQINRPTTQKTSKTINRIAIKSNAPGADSANNPVEKVNTQNISGPSITIFCSRFSGLTITPRFIVKNFNPNRVIIRKYM